MSVSLGFASVVNQKDPGQHRRQETNESTAASSLFQLSSWRKRFPWLFRNDNGNTNNKQQQESMNEADIVCPAYPGLMTLLDAALYRTFEGQLTASVSSANAALHAFLQLKVQSNALLIACRSVIPKCCSSSASHFKQNRQQDHPSQQQQQQQQQLKNLNTLESFALFCIASASEAIGNITTDKLASSANLPSVGNPIELSSSSGFALLQDIDFAKAVGESSKWTWNEVVLRLASHQQHDVRKRDCWESTKLYCPDYVWGHEAIMQSQRLVRSMMKHDAVQCMALVPVLDRHVLPEFVDQDARINIMNMFEKVMVLLKDDVPLRLQQFRQGIESDVFVTKRLYLVKNEYRAPFRSFLEAHLHLQRAPRLDLVEEYIALHQSKEGEGTVDKDDIRRVDHFKLLMEKRRQANQKVQDCLRDEKFVAALQIEEKCEEVEITMASMLYPFCELARILCDGNQVVGLVEVPGLLEEDDFLRMQELLRVLKGLLCKKNEVGSSSIGIRPLLMDLQGIPRDTSNILRTMGGSASMTCFPLDQSSSLSPLEQRLASLCLQLKVLCNLGSSNRLSVIKKDKEYLSSTIEGCASFRTDVFSKAYREWCHLSVKQKVIFQGSGDSDTEENTSFEQLSKQMRQAEIEASIALSNINDLLLARDRIKMLRKDRLQKFDILKETLEDCCLREMHCSIELLPIDEYVILSLPDIQSIPGIFDIGLELAGDLAPSC